VSLFSETAGTNTRDLGDDALKSISALSFLCDEAQELQDVSTTLISGVLMFNCRPSAKIAEGDEASEKVRQSEERSDELARPYLVTKTAHARTSVQVTPPP